MSSISRYTLESLPLSLSKYTLESLPLSPFVIEILMSYVNSLLVLEVYHRVLVVQWAYVQCYITWFYRVSHPIMIQNARGRPLKSSKQEILEVKDDHTHDVLSVCQRIMDMARSDINDWFFKEGIPQLVLVEDIIAEARNVL